MRTAARAVTAPSALARACVLLVSACAALAAGCGGASLCASSAECPDGTACRADGSCAPPPRPRGRVGRSLWLAAGQWGVTRDDRIDTVVPATDVALLGGDPDATVHLAFGPLPERGRIARALLRLVPHESWSGPTARTRVLVDRTEAFEGARLTRRREPRRIAGPIAEGVVAPGGPRPILLDLTDAVRRAERMGLARLHLAVRLADPSGPPWRLASPRALDRSARPRLELLLR